MTDLLKKDQKWQWKAEQLETFCLLQAALTQPITQYSEFTKPFVITMDTSRFAVEAIFIQGKMGQDKLIPFAIRTLNVTE